MSARGYQLFEVMLVCSLLGLLSTLFVPMLQGIADQEKLHAASQMFRSTILNARSQAIAKNSALRIRIHQDRRKFAIASRGKEPTLWRDLPGGVEFSRIPRSLPTFYSRGTASPAGSFILSNNCGRIVIVISVSGRVRWERLD